MGYVDLKRANTLMQEDRMGIEAGMALAYELPYYVNGVGGSQNEDDLLIAETGYETFNTLPMDLVQID